MGLTKSQIVAGILRLDSEALPKGFDYARPAGFDAQCRELGIDPTFYVWGPDNRPINLLETAVKVGFALMPMGSSKTVVMEIFSHMDMGADQIEEIYLSR